MRKLTVRYKTEKELTDILNYMRKRHSGVKVDYAGLSGRPPVESEKTRKWLRRYLKEHGQTELEVIRKAAKEAGIAWTTVRAQSRELDIVRTMPNKKMGATWRLVQTKA